jgi:hypothetical protein
MSIKLLQGCGGCHTTVNVTDWIDVIDSALLPASDIGVWGLLIDGVPYQIEDIFSDRIALVSYLNGTFVPTESLNVIFRKDGNYIQWESDTYSTIEVMAIYQPTLLIFKVGTPAATVNKTTINVANGTVITNAALENEVLSVQIDDLNAQPITASGYIHDNVLGTLTFAATQTDVHIYVITKQVPV